MHTTTTFSLLALLGSALAAPAPRGGYGQPHVVYTTEVVTVVVTGGAPEATYQPPKVEPTVVYTTVEQPKPTTSVEPQPTYAPEPEKPSTTVEPPKETSSPDSGYMGTINTWRAKLGLKDLIHDDKLQANAANTCDEGNGEMKHKLNPGTMGQVLAPGKPEDFEHVFVGGWLCELPNMPGMDGVCAEQSKGWTYEGQTGHAEILTSDSYSKIGCACVEGIWGCDLA